MSAGVRRAKGGRNPSAIAIIVDDRRWRGKASALKLIRRAAVLALKERTQPTSSPLTLLLTGDETLKDLNRRFRGRNKPTNVLSFPGGAAYLGDIALAYETIAREAGEQGKSFAAHAAHMAAHGVLHLLGHDHETLREARVMEPLETGILGRLGFPDPYAPEEKPGQSRAKPLPKRRKTP